VIPIRLFAIGGTNLCALMKESLTMSLIVPHFASETNCSEGDMSIQKMAEQASTVGCVVPREAHCLQLVS